MPRLSDHFDGKLFHNTEGSDRTFLDLIKWKWTGKPAPWPLKREILPRTHLSSRVKGALDITLINHSTTLIQWNDLNILTDPIYSERASPFPFIGPKRIHPPGIPFESLPPIDLVLISHNHYDHMDLPTLQALEAKFKPLFITGLGNKAYLQSKGLHNIAELDWWEEHDFMPFKIVFTPAQHFSARWPWDKDKTLWGGFLIRSPEHSLYFAGDTGYCSAFAQIASRYGPPLVSFLPIGAYKPPWFMSPAHLSPAEALQAHSDLDSRIMVPIHFGTFQMADESLEDPLNDLNKALLEKKARGVHILQPGESLLFQIQE